MTIIHVSTPMSWRGGEQQLSYLAEELESKKINQLILCPNNSKLHQYCKDKKLKHQTYNNKGFLKLGLAKVIKKACKKFRHPIIHTHDSHGHTAAFMAAAFLGNKTPIIVSRRVDFPVKNSIFSKWKYNHKHIKKIVCVSKTIENITAPSIKDKSKLVTVHSGIDLSRFKDIRASGILRKKYNIPQNIKIIGNVAALADHKDYFTFVNTAKALKEQGKPYKFFAIGDGPMKVEITEYINKTGMQDDIIMTGFMDNIPEILPELDVFLITSKTEGLGTSVLDAFACKVPVVATKGGGIPEMVIHEKTGMLAEIKDAQNLAKNVTRIIEDSNLRQEAINNATEKLQEFTKQATAEKTLEIYYSF